MNTTDSQPISTSSKLRGKTFKRGRWIKVTKGAYAGTKRWLSAETRTKMSQRVIVSKPWTKVGSKKAPPVETETGTVVRLSQETATKLSNGIEGLTLDGAVEYMLTYYLENMLSRGERLVRKNYISIEAPPSNSEE